MTDQIRNREANPLPHREKGCRESSISRGKWEAPAKDPRRTSGATLRMYSSPCTYRNTTRQPCRKLNRLSSLSFHGSYKIRIYRRPRATKFDYYLPSISPICLTSVAPGSLSAQSLLGNWQPRVETKQGLTQTRSQKSYIPQNMITNNWGPTRCQREAGARTPGSPPWDDPSQLSRHAAQYCCNRSMLRGTCVGLRDSSPKHDGPPARSAQMDHVRPTQQPVETQQLLDGMRQKPKLF